SASQSTVCGLACKRYSRQLRRRQLILDSRPHVDYKPLSTGRLSEYPTDYFVGICFETSAVAEQNTLWLCKIAHSQKLTAHVAEDVLDSAYRNEAALTISLMGLLA